VTDLLGHTKTFISEEHRETLERFNHKIQNKPFDNFITELQFLEMSSKKYLTNDFLIPISGF